MHYRVKRGYEKMSLLKTSYSKLDVTHELF
jgi:hypothetical protein